MHAFGCVFVGVSVCVCVSVCVSGSNSCLLQSMCLHMLVVMFFRASTAVITFHSLNWAVATISIILSTLCFLHCLLEI